MNPDAHDTIAKQWDAEADALEDSAKACRRQASEARLMAWYARVMSQLAPAK